jgi:1,4-alpha-glucan branching enzyme/maltooligosyltrehalose trehalohydrolase
LFVFLLDVVQEVAEMVILADRRDVGLFELFNSPEAQAQIPDPSAQETLLRSKLDWDSARHEPHSKCLQFYRKLLALRRDVIVPRIKDMASGQAHFEVVPPLGLDVRWPFAQSGSLQLIANFGRSPLALPNKPEGELLYTTSEAHDPAWKEIPGLASAWFLNA